MKTFAAIVLLLILSRASCGVGEAATLTTEQSSAVDRIVEDAIARFHVPGVSIAIARDGDIMYAHGYGSRDVEAKAPVDGSTVFEIGSVTKQFTAASIMLLVQAGKIRLDAPIATYLDAIPSGKTITVRELLTHTSGLPNYTDTSRFATLSQHAAKPRELVASIAKLPLDFKPGTKWSYSNTNYVVLGMLVERESGESYPDFVRTHIFEPLRLTHTRYSRTYLTQGDVAAPYEAGMAAPKRLPARLNLDWAYAAGALWSNAPDLVRWENALFSGRVVDATSLAAMTTPAVLANGAPTTYGFGLMTSAVGGQREIWHNGGLPGYASIDAYFPEQHLEIAVLGNTIAFEPGTVVRNVLAVLVPSVATNIALEATATPAPGEEPAMTALATSLVAQAQSGTLTRSLFDARMLEGLTPAAVGGIASQLAPLGKPKAITFLRKRVTGTYHGYVYRIVWDGISLDESFALDADGKIAGWLFAPASDGTPAPSGSASAAPTTAPSASPSASAQPSPAAS
jgi:CubicO group peptidase (beta-lactamase class C family)